MIEDSIDPRLMAPNWNSIDAAEIVSPPILHDGCRVVVELNVGEVLIEFFDFGMRLFTRQQSVNSGTDDGLTVNDDGLTVNGYGLTVNDYGLIVKKPSPIDIELSSNRQSSRISGGEYVLEIEHKPFSFTFSERSGRIVLKSSDDGHFVREKRLPPLARTSSGWVFNTALKSSEPVYGLGEKWSALNKRGQIVRSYNHDALGVNGEYSYKNTPFCWSPEGWGMFVNTPSPVTHSVGHAAWSHRTYSCLVESDYFDLYLFSSGESNVGAQLLSQYTELTGRAPIPPDWSGGVILSKAYYADADEILSVAHEVRKRAMPCDVITFDGRAWQDTQTRFAFEWDAKRYPDPHKVIDELKQLDFKICVWEYPLISVKHAWFEKFSQQGWLIKDSRTGGAYEYEWDRQAFDDVLTPLPNSGIVDFTHPDAYAFWRDAHKPLFELGVDMIKADFGEQLEDQNMLAHNGENGTTLHNVYAHLYNRCVFEAAEMYSKSGAFLFSRSAWTGSQRFNSQWGGDPQADWEGMMANIRGGLSWGLSGAPFYATDVGGFYKDRRDDSLYVRWAQAAVFSAHFRLHGIGSREPWSYSDVANHAVMQALQLRYQLQHYLQHTMRIASESGLPVQRPMVLAFPDEKQSWAFENQFMFGEHILVVPCFDPNGSVEFYLPQGKWLQFTPNNDDAPLMLQGGQVHQLQLALADMATFIQEGVSIPLNTPAQQTGAIPTSESGDFAVERYWPQMPKDNN